MTRYAAETNVPVNRTVQAIETRLTNFGAAGFGYSWHGNTSRIAFEARGRHIRFDLPMPIHDDFYASPSGRTRNARTAELLFAQAVRATWRGLLLIVRAKLEAIEGGIVTFEDEFLPHTVLASGKTVAEEIGGALALSYERGEVPKLMIGGAR